MENYRHYDEGSFCLGMIKAFTEVVQQEVKPLALSPIMSNSLWDDLEAYAIEIFNEFDTDYYVEKDFISTNLAPDNLIKDKIVVLIYSDIGIKEKYFELKERVEELKKQDSYNDGAKTEISNSLRRLLGYSEKAISENRPTAYEERD